MTSGVFQPFDILQPQVLFHSKFYFLSRLTKIRNLLNFIDEKQDVWEGKAICYKKATDSKQVIAGFKTGIVVRYSFQCLRGALRNASRTLKRLWHSYFSYQITLKLQTNFLNRKEMARPACTSRLSFGICAVAKKKSKQSGLPLESSPARKMKILLNVQ